LLGTFQVVAKIPAEYRPMVVEPPSNFSERVFDLTNAVDRANREGKALFIYLGAEDCPPCRQYFLFLEDNREQLKSSFDRVIVVDIRTWLKGPALVFKVGDKRFSFVGFNALVGDTNRTLTYPYYWLITPDLKQVKQLPRGSTNYMSVDRHRELLRLP
jgi:thiol-disulfide isomerase/thioredoxin